MQNSGQAERTVLLPPDEFSRLKLGNKCVCSRGSAPDHAGGACSAPPDSLAGLRGPIAKGRGIGRKGRGKKRGGEGKGREGRGMPPLQGG